MFTSRSLLIAVSLAALAGCNQRSTSKNFDRVQGASSNTSGSPTTGVSGPTMPKEKDAKPDSAPSTEKTGAGWGTVGEGKYAPPTAARQPGYPASSAKTSEQTKR